MTFSQKSRLSWLEAKNPMILASSGGNGHISAAQSLIQEFQQRQKKLPSHFVAQPQKKLLSSEFLIWSTLYLLNTPLLKKIQGLQKQFWIPSPLQLKKEKVLLIKQHTNVKRFYIDYLLDLLPNGFLYTAIFNLLQSQGHGPMLYQISKGQTILDSLYKASMSKKIYQKLIQGIENQQPFDIIISTQALGIPALCHAVSLYNKNRMALENQYQQKLPTLYIHQFITDIPKISAQHYLKPLQKLKPQEKKWISIHSIELEGINPFQEQQLAHEFYFYAPEHNPIIRPELRTSKNFHDLFGFNWIKVNHQAITLLPKQKLAVLMLSSAQGQTTIDYINHLIAKGIHHIAIVGKANSKIIQYIASIQNQYSTKFYCLGHLHARHLKKLLAAAHLLIIKGGGLSLMELASFSLRKKCHIFVHHTTASLNEKNPAGLIWEEGNIRWFMEYCQKNNKKAYLTNIHQFKNQSFDW